MMNEPGAYFDEIESFGGIMFETLIEIEPDGTISIYTPYRPGYGSAHIKCVYEQVGPSQKEIETSIGSRTMLFVLSVWQRQS